MTKYRTVLADQDNVTSANRGFRTEDHTIATYEQTKKGHYYFYPKRIVEDDGLHTFPLNL